MISAAAAALIAGPGSPSPGTGTSREAPSAAPPSAEWPSPIEARVAAPMNRMRAEHKGADKGSDKA